MDIEGFAQFLADDLKRGTDDGVVAGGPRALLACLEGSQIDRAGLGVLNGGRCNHDYSPFGLVGDVAAIV
jgi:hypothetical protein